MKPQTPNLLGYPLVLLEATRLDAAWYFALEKWWTRQPEAQNHALLMLWQTRPTLMLGRYQNPMEELNLDVVRAKGITCVRRPSGGGTIYTDEGGWQFSFIHPNLSEQEEMTLEPETEDSATTGDLDLDSRFRPYIRRIVDALNHLGWPVTFSGRNDLLLNGKKISGNAQYRLNGYVVHHGSLLFSTDLDAMTEASRPPQYKCTSKGVSSVRERVMNLSEALPPAHNELDSKGFRPLLLRTLLYLDSDQPLPERTLTEQQIKEVERIAEEYRGVERLWQKNPAFSIEHEGQFSGGHLYFDLEVEHGVIQACAFRGDFFAVQELAQLEKSLCGCLYDRTAVRARLEAFRERWPFCAIEPDEVASLIPETGQSQCDQDSLVRKPAG